MSCHHTFFRQWNRNPFAPGVNMKRSGIKRHGCAGAVAALKTGFPAVCLLAVFTTVLMSQGSSPPVVTGNARVDKLLGQMTLDEKISLIHGGPEAQPSGIGGAGTWPGVPRLGIPSLRLVDGPPGISNNVWSTGMTSTMGLAATWSRDDARKNGIVIGRDAKALGQDVALEPFVNIVRDFTFGRAHNTFGEDPFLSGQIAAAQIQGTQGEGIMSQIKHYVAYEGANDVIVDAQTLREIYIAPFADTVAAGVSSIMCSYNKINGTYSCGNGEVYRILKEESGFKGFNTSDWGATHSTLYINEGLDLEMPGGTFFAPVPGQGGRGAGGAPGATGAGAPTGRGGQTAAAGRAGAAAAVPGGMPAVNPGGMQGGFPGMAAGMPEEQSTGARGGGMGGRGGRGTDPPPIGMLEAVRSGQVKEATITMAVGRILVQMDKFGLLDGKQKHTITAEDHAFNAPILQKTAEDAATLLKNQDNVLPLTTADLAATAFIGPTGRTLVSVGQTGERAQGLPDHQVGPVPALEMIAGRKLTYAPANDFDGTPIPASAFSNLTRTDTASKQTQADTELNFTVSNHKALPAGTSFSWAGTLTTPSDGTYTFALQTRGTTGIVELDGARILGGGGGRGFGGGGGGGGAAVAQPPQLPPAVAALRGQHPISGNIVPTVDKLNNARARIEIKAGAHQLTVTSTGEQFGNPVQLRLAWVTPEQEQANYGAAIAAARQAKKAVVFAWGRDRPEVFQLTPEQTRLIQDVAAVNPNTIVVLNTSLPVAMPWFDKVKGVLQMWWPGDQGGPATANVLLGRANPAGRLPITWPERLDQMVAQDPKGHPERTNAGIDGRTTYSEGIFVGYRWFDQQNLKPMFPFGYGLSYTSFQYSGMRVTRAGDGGLDVRFTLKNTGRAAGDEVPQVYVGAPKNPAAGAQFALRALVQYDRVTLAPGQSRTLTLHIEPRRLQYWSAAAGKWQTAAGPRTVYVGASSRDLRLQADVSIAN
jgi:beta-glucosidase